MPELPPILSVRNPWASGILLAGKDVENRTKPFPRRRLGRVLIHCGQKYDDRACPPASLPMGWSLHATRLAEMRGVILGSVDIYDSVRAEECQLDWCQQVTGMHAWLLRDPLIFPEPVQCRGALGLFPVPQAIHDQVAAQISRQLTPEQWRVANKKETPINAKPGEKVGSAFD